MPGGRVTAWECLAEEKEAEENKENVDGSKDKEAEAGKKKVEHEISEGNVATAAAAALASAATKAKVGAVPTPWARLQDPRNVVFTL